MNKIDLFTGPNMGGITRLYYCPAFGIDSISDPDANGYVTVSFKNGFNWYEIVAALETTSFEDKSVKVPAGVYFEKMITFLIPKDRAEILETLNDFFQLRLICRYKDANGQYKIVGDLEYPLKFSYQLTVPSQTKNLNGIFGTFKGYGACLSYFDANQS